MAHDGSGVQPPVQSTTAKTEIFKKGKAKFTYKECKGMGFPNYNKNTAQVFKGKEILITKIVTITLVFSWWENNNFPTIISFTRVMMSL